jgi:hypothetical protein
MKEQTDSRMSKSAGQQLARDHLYVDDDGIIRDAHIEYMFRDIYEDTEQQEVQDEANITLHNFQTYARMIFPDAGPVPDDVLTNDLSAIDWCSKVGVLSISVIREHLTPDPDIKRLGLTHIVRLSRGQEATKPTMGRGLGRACLLSVLQAMREHTFAHNNGVSLRQGITNARRH